ncbi:MAG TPA: ABC transporter ATP-binding protein [Candidatus Polarisedimenticolaceae bacterium]|nr:ABC transporter ATP-binding protein [Candidatus Polarisedimenticolaceae bacterium]
MIEIASLSKTFGRVDALAGIDLSIGRGMFGLLGPNGAGKTTLMRILAGIVRPTQGTVRVGAHDHSTDAGKRATKSILGYLPQELGMYPELTAEQLVDYMAILKGIDDGRVRRKRVAEVLEMVALSDVTARKIKGFSGGMKRRVGIAQALVNDPKLLIVDEPTAGLDPEERIRFRNLLVRLAGERTVILSTHIVEDIGQTCRDLAVLGKGRILFRGSPGDLARVAEGHVWSVVTPRIEEPSFGTTIVSMLHLADAVQLRVVGPRPGPHAEPAAPSLEDGYVRLMQGARG